MDVVEADYKTAKEAFVADNPGETIWAIQITSLTALFAYALYAVLSKRTRGPLVDYLAVVLPLLLSVTVCSTTRSALVLHAVLILLATAVHVVKPAGSKEVNRPNSKKSQGKWLDESDSEEEPSQPVYNSSTSYPLSRLSTSSSADASGSSRPISPVDPPATSSTLSPDRAEKPEISRRTFKRRHSPTPSTHTHTAIDVLQTPETDTLSTGPNPAYPPHPRARVSTGQNGQRHGRETGRLPFLSVYRAHMMIMTIHCILAVDFPIFPRVQGKCEDFGTSLMDVGVGSFVFSLGLVSARSVSAASSENMVFAMFKALKKASPILGLGLIRVLMVKGTEYPEHVTEYGVHWNFFFTLGLLPVLGIAISPLRNYIGWTPLALVVAFLHQISLSRLGLQTWILSPERVGLIGLNKEGIVSLPGYLAIYALGLGIGEHVLRDPLAPAASHHTDSGVVETRAEHVRSRMEKRRSESAMELFGYSIAWWVLLLAVRLVGEQVSRRMANLPYVLWTAAYNTTFLLGYLAIEILFFPPSIDGSASLAVPPLLEAINRNGLAVFLVANLATGLVNVSLKTMYASDSVALLVLGLYSAGVCALAWLCRGLRLKV